jgi:hypothetical protein
MNVGAERLAYPPAARAALPALFIAPLLLLALTPRFDTTPALAATLCVAALGLGAWLLLLMATAARAGRTLEVDVQVVRTHWVQGLVHTAIFTWWALYWPFIIGQAPLMLAQILFAYSFSALLTWSRGRRWRLGFGPVPIILSTNFFMCFKDEWFYLQLLMIALGFLGKEFIHWRRDGRDTHIFNPSALALFTVSVALIATGRTAITWAEPIAIQLDRPEHIYLVIFLAGLIVQGLFRVTLVTLAAALALYLLGLGYTAATGVYWFMDAGIPIAVFLGLHLLITDPATSPRSDRGRFLFGALYGAGVFAAYGLLEWLGAPRFYDKLLCVPLLNLAVPWIERLGRALPRAPLAARMPLAAWPPGRRNLLYMTCWAALFFWMSATHFIGRDFPGLGTGFWTTACSRGLRDGCRNLANIRRDDCNAGDATACLQLAALTPRVAALRADPLAPVRALARGCDLSSPAACLELRDRLDSRANAQLDARCNGGSAHSCYILGSANLLGIGRATDLPRAAGYFARSCRLGNPTGCSVAADFHRYGVGGVPKDAAAALAGHAWACNHTYFPSCMSLAQMLQRGEGAAPDRRRAGAIIEETCLLGYRPACAARGVPVAQLQ